MPESGRDIPHWYRPRGYRHFDTPLSLDRARELVENPVAVARHAFWPMLRFTREAQKAQREALSGKFNRVTKLRTLATPAHADRYIYAHYTRMLQQKLEARLAAEGLSESVLAFRLPGRSNIICARDAFRGIADLGPCTAIATDIRGYFDHMDHAWLKQSWQELLGVERLPADQYAVYRSLTRTATVDRERVYAALGIARNHRPSWPEPLCSASDFRHRVRGGALIEVNHSGRGVPQGASTSAILSNVYLLAFDRAMLGLACERGGSYMRFCDDILLLLPGQMDAATILQAVDAQLGLCKLERNVDKTEVRNFDWQAGQGLRSDKPLQYLGFLYDGQRIWLRPAGLARYSRRMKQAVSTARQSQRKYNRIRARRGLPPRDVFRQRLYRAYSYLGRRSYPGYGYRAARIMQSQAIRRQLKPLWSNLQSELAKQAKSPRIDDAHGPRTGTQIQQNKYSGV